MALAGHVLVAIRPPVDLFCTDSSTFCLELFFRPLLAFPDHDGQARPLLSDCDRAAGKILSSTTPSSGAPGILVVSDVK